MKALFTVGQILGCLLIACTLAMICAVGGLTLLGSTYKPKPETILKAEAPAKKLDDSPTKGDIVEEEHPCHYHTYNQDVCDDVGN